MHRTFVIGDIHGAYRALRQCLDRSGFDYKHDRLICLGDVSDGWPETKSCIDELLRLRSLIYILGNHDLWTLQWMKTGTAEELWLSQGGDATIHSYEGSAVPDKHVTLLAQALPYYMDKNNLFVHAGIETDLAFEEQDLSIFLWTRTLAAKTLMAYKNDQRTALTKFEEVYIGHTPIPYDKPITAGGVWLMDTGAAWSGVLSLMDVTSKEIFTSDQVSALYPGVPGRKRK